MEQRRYGLPIRDVPVLVVPRGCAAYQAYPARPPATMADRATAMTSLRLFFMTSPSDCRKDDTCVLTLMAFSPYRNSRS